jgi:hypothetical protein
VILCTIIVLLYTRLPASTGGTNHAARRPVRGPVPEVNASRATEQNWRAAAAPPGFVVSESPRYVGRAVVALAADPGHARWNTRSVTSAQLAAEYGFTDVDGSRPDVWAYERAVEAGDRDAGPSDYR